MAKTRNDKKREILEYLEEKSTNGGILSLRKDEIIEQFNDDYPDESIGEILDEIIDEEPVSEESHTLSLIYPEKFSDKVERQIQSGDDWNIRTVFFVGYYLLFFAVISDASLNGFFINATDEQIVWISLVGISSSYVLGTAARKISNLLLSRISLFREHKSIIYSIGGVFAISVFIMFAYGHYSSQEISLAVVGTFFTGSILAGVQLGKYFDGRRDEDAD